MCNCHSISYLAFSKGTVLKGACFGMYEYSYKMETLDCMCEYGPHIVR